MTTLLIMTDTMSYKLPQVRVRLVKERTVTVRDSASTPENVASIAHKLLGDSPTESILVFHLDNRMSVISVEEISRGGLDGAAFLARDAFRSAVLACATAVIFVHNHPSGDAEPSHSDCRTAEALDAAGRLLGIPVLDHIIVTSNPKCWSNRRH